MSILIDGYNLLHVSGVFGVPGSPHAFRQSRERLIAMLAGALGDEAQRTQIVFDASDAPPGLPKLARMNGITVHFASDHESADHLLEELILRDNAPRRLTVVSSDHRVQRAARRRRAKTFDSDVWLASLRRPAPDSAADTSAEIAKVDSHLDEVAVREWLREFNITPARTPEESADRDGMNPFPPGY
jgi:predicted RNA-binding protein with PIN domain